MKFNKIFFIIFFIFLILFSLCLNSFASWDAEYEGVTYTLPDLPSDFDSNTHYIIVMTSWAGSEYYSIYYTSDEDCKFVCTSNGFNIVDSEGNTCNNYIRDANMTTLTWGNAKVWGYLTNVASFVTASDTIYNEDGTIFFQIPPLIYQIPEIAEVVQIPEVIVGVLKVIIPVSLIVLLVVFLIFLIKSAISRMV